MQKQIESAELVCHNCGYHWTPQPQRWRNAQFVERKGKQVKVLKCPVCNVLIGMDRKQYKRILKKIFGQLEPKRIPKRGGAR